MQRRSEAFLLIVPVHNMMNCGSIAQPVQLKKYANYDSAFDDGFSYVDRCQFKPSTAP